MAKALGMETLKYRDCKNCGKVFPYRETLRVRSSFSKPLNMMIGGVKQMYCTDRCALLYRNKYNNPASSETGRKKISESAKKRGVKHMQTPEARAKQIKTISGSGHWNWMGGVSHPKCIDCGKTITFKKKRCIPCNGKYYVGERRASWKGGVSNINKRIRASAEGRKWRKKVFERDNYTCVFCGIRSKVGVKVYLNADHIKPFALYPELRFELSNGRTLCTDCHRKTDTYGHNKKYSKKYPLVLD